MARPSPTSQIHDGGVLPPFSPHLSICQVQHCSKREPESSQNTHLDALLGAQSPEVLGLLDMQTFQHPSRRELYKHCSLPERSGQFTFNPSEVSLNTHEAENTRVSTEYHFSTLRLDSRDSKAPQSDLNVVLWPRKPPSLQRKERVGPGLAPFLLAVSKFYSHSCQRGCKEAEKPPGDGTKLQWLFPAVLLHRAD